MKRQTLLATGLALTTVFSVTAGAAPKNKLPFRCQATYSNDLAHIQSEELVFKHVGNEPKPGQGYYLWALRAYSADKEIMVQGDYNEKENYGTMSIYRPARDGNTYVGTIRNFTFSANGQPAFLEHTELDKDNLNINKGSVSMTCWKTK